MVDVSSSVMSKVVGTAGPDKSEGMAIRGLAGTGTMNSMRGTTFYCKSAKQKKIHP